MTGGQVGTLALVALAALAYFAVAAQLNPFTRCEACEGRAPGDGSGNYHRCGKCGGASEVLRFGAWLQIKMGISVPRAKGVEKKHRKSL